VYRVLVTDGFGSVAKHETAKPWENQALGKAGSRGSRKSSSRRAEEPSDVAHDDTQDVAGHNSGLRGFLLRRSRWSSVFAAFGRSIFTRTSNFRSAGYACWSERPNFTTGTTTERATRVTTRISARSWISSSAPTPTPATSPSHRE